MTRGHFEREIQGNTLCPCGSGDVYRKCCKGKLQKWIKSSEGDLVKSVAFKEPVLDIISDLKLNFVETFGREPSAGDLVFPNLFFSSSEEHTNEVILAMERVGIREELIYVYWKTGFVVSEETYNSLSPRDRKEYDQAMDEYFRVYADAAAKPWKPSRDPYEDWYHNTLWIVGAVVRRISEAKEEKVVDAEFATVCFLTRMLRTLRSINHLTSNNSFSDSLVLLRTMLEIFIFLKYITSSHSRFESLVLAPMGLRLGTPERKLRTDGMPEQDIVVENTTFREIRTHRAKW